MAEEAGKVEITESIISKTLRIIRTPTFIAGVAFMLLGLVCMFAFPAMFGPFGVLLGILCMTFLEGIAIVFYVLTAKYVGTVFRRKRTYKYWDSRE
ncbi:MAG: hypothetical protein GXO26_08275 [Crenarchaeota archaeon]|nr:hypothetical protein [Thermoproteota archaeon]